MKSREKLEKELTSLIRSQKRYKNVPRGLLSYINKDKPKDLIKLSGRKIVRIIELFEKLEYTSNTAFDRWLEVSIYTSANYKHIPKMPHQDNKSYLATSNSSHSLTNYPKIRYPKKCRKTAWKRFFKLFPHLKQIIKN